MLEQIAVTGGWIAGLVIALSVVCYGLYRAIRSPLRPLAAFAHAWEIAFLFPLRINRRLPLVVLAALSVGQGLQIFFHLFPALGSAALVIISVIWQFALAIFLALCGANFQLLALPMLPFVQPDVDARLQLRRIAVPVILWAAAVWLVGMALTVLFNLARLYSPPEWRWDIAVPTPMLLYLLETPFFLVRPALVLGQSGRDGLTAAMRHVVALLLLNFLFTIPPFVFPLFVLTFAGLIGRSTALLLGQVGVVLLTLFQFLAYEAASLLCFGMAVRLRAKWQ